VGVLIPVGILVGFVVLVVLFYVSRLRMPAPGEALIVYGSVGKGSGRGIKVVTEGSIFVWPGLQRYTTISLSAMPFTVSTGGIRTKEGVYIQIEAPTTLKIDNTHEAITLAAEMFAGKQRTEIVEVARKTLEGHLRAICAAMTLDEVNEDRKRLQQEMQDVSAADFAKMGLHIVSFNIEKIVDEEGILQLKGKQQAAEQKAATEIGIARAQRESAQNVADANKQAEIARITASQEVADAQKDLDLKQAKNQQEVKTAQAVTDQSYKLKELEIQQQITQKEVAVQITKAERSAELADAERVLVQKQLLSTVEEPALAEKRKQQILAEAQVLQAEQAAKAHMLKREAEGSAEAKYAQTVAQAKAEANRMEGLAQAEVIRQKGLSEAEVGAAQAKVIREKGLAEAEIEKAQGINRAEVVKAMAEAQKLEGLALAEAQKAQQMAAVEAERARMQILAETMNEQMLQYHLIQKLPEIITALAGVFPKYEKATFIDMGGGGAMGQTDKFAGSVIRMLGSVLPIVESMTGVEVGKALLGALRSPEGQKAAAEAGVDSTELSAIGQVIETLQFPGGKAVAVAEVQKAINANPGLAEMALNALQGAAAEVKAADATKG
jgi:flotillin